MNGVYEYVVAIYPYQQEVLSDPMPWSRAVMLAEAMMAAGFSRVTILRADAVKGD